MSSLRFSDLPYSDVVCVSCGYCLRGQTLEGRCSECGLPAAVSAARVADRAIVKQAIVGESDARRQSDLQYGVWLLLAAGALIALTMFSQNDRFLESLRPIGKLAAHTLAAAALIVCTRQSKSTPTRGIDRWLRGSIRTAAIGSIALYVLQLLMASGRKQLTFSERTLLLLVPVLIDILGNTLLLFYAGWITRITGRREVCIVATVCGVLSSIFLFIGLFGSQISYIGGYDRDVSLVGLGFSPALLAGGNGWGFRWSGVPNSWMMLSQFLVSILRAPVAWGTLFVAVQLSLLPRKTAPSGEP